jgi:hypothetical protein
MLLRSVKLNLKINMSTFPTPRENDLVELKAKISKISKLLIILSLKRTLITLNLTLLSIYGHATT